MSQQIPEVQKYAIFGNDNSVKLSVNKKLKFVNHKMMKPIVFKKLF